MILLHPRNLLAGPNRLWWLALLLLLWGPGQVTAQPEADEEAAKSALIYAFAKFVEWPSESFDSDESPFVIAIIGQPRMAEALLTLTDKRVHGRGIQVVELKSPGDRGDYQVLYSDWASLRVYEDEQSGSLAAQHVLTIGEEDGFAENGGVLRLMLVDDHLRFVINSTAARRAGLSLSSSLYGLAHSVLEESE